MIHTFGDFDVLRYADIETPKPEPGHILIKLLAAGVNRLGHYLREGATPYQRDPKMVDFHLLDTDHFALEEDGTSSETFWRRGWQLPGELERADSARTSIGGLFAASQPRRLPSAVP